MSMSKSKVAEKAAATEKTDLKTPEAASKKKQLAGKGDFAEQEKNLKPSDASKKKDSYGGGSSGGGGASGSW
jgi:hypothetical protein